MIPDKDIAYQRKYQKFELDTKLLWPPSVNTIELDRQVAFEYWSEKTRWFENIPHSNFLPLKVSFMYEGRSYKTVEHFYQAMKSQNPDYRDAIAKCETPNKTKFLAYKLAARDEIREDWDEIRILVMKQGQIHRIETDPLFYDWLRQTRGSYIYEWNNWADYFFGVCVRTGRGENILGRILVHLRDEVYFPQRRD